MHILKPKIYIFCFFLINFMHVQIDDNGSINLFSEINKIIEANTFKIW